MEHSSTGEPTHYGYDPTNISCTLNVLENGSPMTYTSANVSKLTALLQNAKYESSTSGAAFSRLSVSSNAGVLTVSGGGQARLRIELKNIGGRLRPVFTSLAPGCVKLTLDGWEYAFITPGDVNLDGEMDSNDWSTVMRWTLEAPSRFDITDLPEFKINGRPYDLWALLADVDGAKLTDDRKDMVDSNDWATIMYLTLEAWKK